MQNILRLFKPKKPTLETDEKPSKQSLIKKLNEIEYKTDEHGGMHFSCNSDKEDFETLSEQIRTLSKP